MCDTSGGIRWDKWPTGPSPQCTLTFFFASNRSGNLHNPHLCLHSRRHPPPKYAPPVQLSSAGRPALCDPERFLFKEEQAALAHTALTCPALSHLSQEWPCLHFCHVSVDLVLLVSLKVSFSERSSLDLIAFQWQRGGWFPVPRTS